MNGSEAMDGGPTAAAGPRLEGLTREEAIVLAVDVLDKAIRGDAAAPGEA